MIKKIYALVLSLMFGQAAFAGVMIPFSFGGAINDVSFNNYEMVFREAANGAYSLNGVKYDTVIGDNVAIGDIFVQIFSGTGLEVDGAVVNSPFQQQELTAYSVQRLSAINLAAPGGPELTFGASAVDPFGVFSAADLANQEALRLFADSSKNFTHQSGGNPLGLVAPTAVDLIADVSSATNGTLFAAFGFGAASDAAMGGVTNVLTFFNSKLTAPYALSSRSGTDQGSASAGLNTKTNPFGYTFAGVFGSDLNVHSIIAQSSFSQNVGTLAPGVGVAADFKLARNAGSSNWAYFSDDPFSFTIVPEPSSVMIWGLGICGFGIYSRYRRKQ